MAGIGNSKGEVCRNCGKPVSSTISGSITAWIFKDSCCRCATLHNRPESFEPQGDSNEVGASLSAVNSGSSESVSAKGVRVSKLDAVIRKIDHPGLSTGSNPSIEPLPAVSEHVQAPPRPVVSHLPAPKKFGERYEMVEVIGEGGMAMVYKVRDLVLNQFFAIKVIHPELAKDAVSRKRFELEASTARALNHANIVTMYAFDISPEGVPYLIMEYVDGRNLGTMLAERPLSPVAFYDTFIQVCSALAHAHSRAVIHRDIKPSNIIVANLSANSTWIKLADFGIAKMLTPGEDGAKTLTQSGDFLGSPFYVSPEQAVGDQIDARSDIYSLGCVMFHAITGRPPFNASSHVKIILQQINDPPPTLASLNISVPPGLERIIQRCLEKKPDDRYQNVFDLRTDLQLVQQGQEPLMRRNMKEHSNTELSELLDLHKEDTSLNTLFEGVLSFDMRINSVLERIIELAVPGDSLLRVESHNPDFTGIVAIRDGYQVLGAKILKQPTLGYQAFRKVMALADGVFRYQSIICTDYKLPDESLQINLNYILFLYPNIPDSPAELVDQAAIRDLVFAVQTDDSTYQSAIADDTRTYKDKTAEIPDLGFEEEEGKWLSLDTSKSELELIARTNAAAVSARSDTPESKNKGDGAAETTEKDDKALRTAPNNAPAKADSKSDQGALKSDEADKGVPKKDAEKIVAGNRAAKKGKEGKVFKKNGWASKVKLPAFLKRNKLEIAMSIIVIGLLIGLACVVLNPEFGIKQSPEQQTPAAAEEQKNQEPEEVKKEKAKPTAPKKSGRSTKASNKKIKKKAAKRER